MLYCGHPFGFWNLKPVPPVYCMPFPNYKQHHFWGTVYLHLAGTQNKNLISSAGFKMYTLGLPLTSGHPITLNSVFIYSIYEIQWSPSYAATLGELGNWPYKRGPLYFSLYKY